MRLEVNYRAISIFDKSGQFDIVKLKINERWKSADVSLLEDVIYVDFNFMLYPYHEVELRRIIKNL